jgi:hypothetical protein
MDWLSTFLPGTNQDAKPILAVLAKRTYGFLQGKVVLADDQIPFIDADQFADPQNPLYSEAIAEAEFVPCKLSTVVIVMGQACCPAGKRAYHLDCVVQAGGLRKAVQVFGDRKIESKAFKGMQFTDPAPFEQREIGYRFAYGGITKNKEGTLLTYLPNPIGKGFCFKGGFDDPTEIPVPNQEDPEHPLSPDFLIRPKVDDVVDGPAPVSFGWTRRNFYPRFTYAGVLPEFMPKAMQSRDELIKAGKTAPPNEIPKMDLRFYNGASEGLYGIRLRGDESVRLEYMDPQYPVFECKLPGEVPVMSLDIGDGAKELKPVLDTVVIDKNNSILTMLWRGSFEYGGIEILGDLPKIEIKVE